MSDPFSNLGGQQQEDQALKMLLKLYDPSNKDRLKMITDLSKEVLSDMVQAGFLNNFLKKEWGIDLKIDKNLINPTLMYLVSIGRQGRLEATEVLKAQREDEKNKNKTFLERLGMTQ